jgi:hypothetical protein
MGGLLSGLDQSLISGANLYMPKDLGLTVQQNSLVNSGMPLGAVGVCSPWRKIYVVLLSWKLPNPALPLVSFSSLSKS